MWTPEIVMARFKEAADVERRLPRVSGPRTGSWWPAFDYDNEDRAGWTDQDRADDRERWAGRRPVTAGELSRYSEVLDWTVAYVPEKMRRMAWAWSFCQAIRGWSFVTACNRHGWKRTTAYSRLEKLWANLSKTLDNDRTLLRLPPDYASRQPTHEIVLEYETVNYRAPSADAVPNKPYRTEPSRDLIATPEDAEAFAAWLADRNAKEARRRRKLGLEDAA